MRWTISFNRVIRSAAIICFVLAASHSVCHAAKAPAAEKSPYAQLNERFIANNITLRTQAAASFAKNLPKPATMDALAELTQKYLQQGDASSALSLALINLKLIKNNLDTQSALVFISLLLDNNLPDIATDLFNVIQSDGEKSLKASASYLFARYYFNENNWQQCLQYLGDIYSDLPEVQASHARLLTGVALQHLKDHRKAISFYERIPQTSDDYLYARLNIAVAYIRQGWWTDAQTTITNALKPYSKSTDNNELVNRLYLVLGYSLLQKEYYRDAREAFRNIHTDSQYGNRALLGIALASASQDDFIGALNALSALRSKDTIDLSVDETYLLFPFVYKNLGQELTATTSYNEAIQYYQTRIDNLGKPKGFDVSNLDAIRHTREAYQLNINNNVFDIGSDLPQSFLKNPQRIDALLKASAGIKPASSKSVEKLNQLKADYASTYKALQKNITNQRKDYLNSYLNQSRYGLANLYDNSLPGSK